MFLTLAPIHLCLQMTCLDGFSLQNEEILRIIWYWYWSNLLHDVHQFHEIDEAHPISNFIYLLRLFNKYYIKTMTYIDFMH